MMSTIERAEQLKSELTDKWVVVSADIPELRRFASLTGKVKTVNMNCRALVEFDGPEDISWYDIDPSYLTVVDGPREKEKPAAEKKAPAKGAGAKPKAAAKAGMSPLEMARAQGAGGAATSDAPAAGGEKKLSPLEMARQQGAGGGAAKTAPEKSEAPAKKLSPLEMARQQGAAGADAPAPPAEEAAEETPVEPAEQAAAEETPAAKPAAPSAEDAKLSPLELARKQGAFKG